MSLASLGWQCSLSKHPGVYQLKLYWIHHWPSGFGVVSEKGDLALLLFFFPFYYKYCAEWIKLGEVPVFELIGTSGFL